MMLKESQSGSGAGLSQGGSGITNGSSPVLSAHSMNRASAQANNQLNMQTINTNNLTNFNLSQIGGPYLVGYKDPGQIPIGQPVRERPAHSTNSTDLLNSNAVAAGFGPMNQHLMNQDPLRGEMMNLQPLKFSQTTQGSQMSSMYSGLHPDSGTSMLGSGMNDPQRGCSQMSYGPMSQVTSVGR